MNTNNHYKGKFITFDGPNGAGKSTLIAEVSSLLSMAGVDLFLTAEPTDSPLGRFIRANEENYRGKTLAYFVALDRYLHLENEILPALINGKVVLCDRYIDSSLVLQRLDGLNFDFIWDLNKYFCVPDLSIILTARVEILEKRLLERDKLTRFERQNSRGNELDYYLDAANYLSEHGFNVMTVDNGDKSIKNNADLIVNKILPLTRITYT